MATLRSLDPSIRVEQRSFDQISAREWNAVEVLHTIFDLPLPSQAPNLRWVQLHIAGSAHALEHPLGATNVTITNASGTHAVQIAEYVFCMLLSRLHQRPAMLDLQRTHVWPATRIQSLPAETLRGKTLGILGYGSVGRQVARVGTAFGMRVLAMQRGTDRRDHGFALPEVGDPDGRLPERYYQPHQLLALLSQSDVVVNALPPTPETHHLLGEAAFQSMPRSAYLVNVGRGTLYEEPTLLRALREGWIAGAILDVFQQEPLPADSPLWDLPNVDISPHVSGNMVGYDVQVSQLFEENLRRYLAGEPLLNVVDKTLGY